MKNARTLLLLALAVALFAGGCSSGRRSKSAGGVMTADVGDPVEASLADAVRAHPRDASAWSRLGCYWNARGRYEAAVGALGRSVRLAPDDAMSRLQLVVGLYHLCRDDDAREQLAVVLRATPKSADAHWLAANLAQRAGDRKGAMAEAASAARLDSARYAAPAFFFAMRAAD